MTRGVGILRAEGRAEGVDLGKRHAIGFDVELTGNGKECFAPKKIFRVIHFAFVRAIVDARQIHHVECRYTEQFARTLGIAGGDDRRIHPQETAFMKEAMNRLRHRVPHARGGTHHIGARPQVRHLAQVLHGVHFRRDRVGIRIVHPANHLDGCGLHFERLALGGRRDDGAGCFHGAAGGELDHFRFVIAQGIRRHHLHRMEAGTIGNADKRNARLGITPGLDPAFDGDRCIGGSLAAEDIDTTKCGHDECLPESVRNREFYLVRAQAPGAAQEFRMGNGWGANIHAVFAAYALARRMDAGV